MKSLGKMILLYLICLSSAFISAAKVMVQSETVGQTLHIAVASNFTSTLKRLVKDFARSTAVKVIISSASTGKLTTQIRYGAPYDILLAADRKHPKLLIAENLAFKNSFYNYAQGQLVLISQHKNAKSALSLLRSDDVKQLAVANSKTAPYGLVAKGWLSDSGFNQKSFQYITGENINQTWQFFQQGGVDAALVAKSQVLLLKENNHHYWLLPQKVNENLNQAGVILINTMKYDIAKQFMTYLKSTQAVLIMQKAGYRVVDVENINTSPIKYPDSEYTSIITIE